MFTGIPLGIQNVETNHVIDGTNGRTYALDWNTGTYQQWLLSPAGQAKDLTMYWKIEQVQSGHVLEQNGDNLILGSRPTNGLNQQWIFRVEDDGTCTILSRDRSCAVQAVGNSYKLLKPSGGKSQRFRVWPYLAPLKLDRSMQPPTFKDTTRLDAKRIDIGERSDIKVSPGAGFHGEVTFEFSRTSRISATFEQKFGSEESWTTSAKVTFSPPATGGPGGEAGFETSTRRELEIGFSHESEIEETTVHTYSRIWDIEYPLKRGEDYWPEPALYTISGWIDWVDDVVIPFQVRGTIKGSYEGKPIAANTLGGLVRALGFEAEITSSKDGELSFTATGNLRGEYGIDMGAEAIWTNQPKTPISP